MTPRQAAVAALPEDAPETTIDAAARAIEADRRQGGPFDARELDLLVKTIDFAVEWPVKSNLAHNDRALARDLVFRMRQMATRAK